MRHDPIRSTNMENRQPVTGLGIFPSVRPAPLESGFRCRPCRLKRSTHGPFLVVPLNMNCRASATRRARARTVPVSDMEAANR